MPAFAQLRLNLRKALSNVSFSLTITFDIVSHLPPSSCRLCIIQLYWVFFALFLLYQKNLVRQQVFSFFCKIFPCRLPGSFFCPAGGRILCCFSCLLLCDLAFQYLSSFCNCFVDLLRILSAGLCHVRTSAAATANDGCYSLIRFPAWAPAF